MDERVHFFGIRHHGPGCARSLAAALSNLEPDLVLVEGPPEGDNLLSLVPDPGMVPPVALMIYPPEYPDQACFYPFTVYSPEWQAIRHAREKSVPVRFIDLPISIRAHLNAGKAAENESAEELDTHPAPSVPEEEETTESAPADPFALLAEAAGYSDHELWWEHYFEERFDPAGMFEAIAETMTSLREEAPAPTGIEAVREAHMRSAIRTALKEGCFERIAVVCGAWHVPALSSPSSQKADSELLKGLRPGKTITAWTPWTNERLSLRGGYGAGVYSPGWYQHLWEHGRGASIRWVIRAAGLLRAEDLDAPSASVIEAVRLADTLAAMRGRPRPGLAELGEAILTVICRGETAPMQLIRRKLEVGDAMGAIPDGSPQTPLQSDLEALRKRLRLKPSPEISPLDLDLREDGGRARSLLLHRLRLIGVPWGTLQDVRGKSGTFHEYWQLQWKVEFAIPLVEAAAWGNSVEAAAHARAADTARKTVDLGLLAQLLDDAILAGLPGLVIHLLDTIRNRGALAADVHSLMAAMPPLARVARYGDVRGTDAAAVEPVITSLFERILVSLPAACASLDSDAAARVRELCGGVQQSLDLLNRHDLLAEWRTALSALTDAAAVHPMLRGFACRLLLAAAVIDREELDRHARLALSRAVPPLDAVSWLEGLLFGSGLLLLHQDDVWLVLDTWLRELDSEAFLEALPLLRRAFSGFEKGERRIMADKVKQLDSGSPNRKTGARAPIQLNDQRAARVLPVLARILGVES